MSVVVNSTKAQGSLDDAIDNLHDHPDEFVQKLLFLRKQCSIEHCRWGGRCRYVQKSSSIWVNVDFCAKYGKESSYASLRGKICKYLHPGESDDQYYKRIRQDSPDDVHDKDRENALDVPRGVMQDRLMHKLFHTWKNSAADELEWIDSMMSAYAEEEWNDELPSEYPDFMWPDYCLHYWDLSPNGLL